MVHNMSDLKELSQSQVPLDRAAPLHTNRLVTFVNHFIVTIAQQLNELSSVVDSRLFDINNQILKCNANLVILEMKLNSISGLSSVTNPDAAQPVPAVSPTPIPQTPQQTESNKTEEVVIDSTAESIANETNIEPQTESNDNSDETVGAEPETEPEDPRLAKYKKMVQLGIPLPAVHQKMRIDGIDPELLS